MSSPSTQYFRYVCTDIRSTEQLFNSSLKTNYYKFIIVKTMFDELEGESQIIGHQELLEEFIEVYRNEPCLSQTKS